mmetsp:Transcript_1442/g.1967  ORF Transcript_1442/g.1967 Transcript_1442/m.1967 type:complete len:740 (+) Transcript_1442:427-2646(+)|eukprot:CAMPEP_0198149760 /NCGR_PEP_ID=MMETSP1443-20131203/48047_1 /TAXON_ID=186043 /ORGANISM="Entomoneis sp., Strain CCMP2396" /LENGTH=739 /DNA_ID=CAMNT_0043814883 /DNA_START=387 /DNA_END=2606 /DNA_ORIENTATION=+
MLKSDPSMLVSQSQSPLAAPEYEEEENSQTVTIMESGTNELLEVPLSEENVNYESGHDHGGSNVENEPSSQHNDEESSPPGSPSPLMKSSTAQSSPTEVAPSTPIQHKTNYEQQELLNLNTPGLTPKRPDVSMTPGGTVDAQQQHHYHHQGLPSLSECLYGVPEDHDVWEGFFAQPDEFVSEQKVPEDAEIWKRQARVRSHPINLGHLRRLAAIGIPDEGSHRGVVWRLLLGPYLTTDNIDEWQGILFEKRSKYYSYCKKYFMWNDWNFGHVLRVQRKQEHRGPLILRLDMDDDYQSVHVTVDESEEEEDQSTYYNGPEDGGEPGGKIPKRPEPFEMFNNPDVLTLIPQSIQDAWTDYGKDLHILKSLQKSFNAIQLPDENDPDAIQEFVQSATLLDEIRKDVVRTHSDLAFFLDPVHDLGRRRYAAIERILFLWAKFNDTGVRYVQGMNEIVGALYYVLANDWRTEWANAAESDSFWLLEALLHDMRDVFVPELDAVDTGIHGRISALQDLLERHDPALKEHFVEIGIDASFYAVRWLTTLLSREFLLPDTIRLWDSMFASTHKDNFLRYVCVTMLFMIRDKLLEGDFVTCIHLLQRYPTVHMEHLLEASRALYIYEMQITVACHKTNMSRHTAILTISPPESLIMAFGFKKGIVPTVHKTSTERVRNAFSRVFTHMRSWSGDAPSTSDTQQQEEEEEEPEPSTTTPNEIPESTLPFDDDPEDIYMRAIMDLEKSEAA